MAGAISSRVSIDGSSVYARFVTLFYLPYIIGIPSCLISYVNIALEKTEQHVNGAVTNYHSLYCPIHPDSRGNVGCASWTL